MPTTLPRTIAGRIEFYRQRLAAWAAEPAAIGLSPGTVDAVAAAVERAETAYLRAQQSRQQARNDTAAQNAALGELNALGSGAIATIRAFADLATNPNAVFTAAELDPPATGGPPVPPPAPATNVRMTLLTSGAVRVEWNGTTAGGTFYDVHRKLAGEAGFTLIGSSAARTFDDATVPAGTPEAAYFCLARRGTLIGGPSLTAVIRFGVIRSATAERIAA